MIELSDRFKRVHELLRQIQPDPAAYDVIWCGPYYLPRPREWCRTHFMLYRGTLYASVLIDGSWRDLSWTLATGEVAWDRGQLGYLHREVWADVLNQAEHRLRSAMRNYDAYNRRVERLLPPAFRTGLITRRLSWPPDVDPPLPVTEVSRIADALDLASGVPHLPDMSLSRYLQTAAVAYDAGFDDVRGLSPMEKYQRRADGRHDGLLDLELEDSAEFAAWFADPAFRGGHPWEIVFGHPHGIMLYLRQHETGWSFSLAAGSEGWYVTAAKMAYALAEHGVPVKFEFWRQMADALLGVDDLKVGPAWPALSYELLVETNPAAAEAIRWDSIPRLEPVTADQLARIETVSSPDGVPATKASAVNAV